MSIERACIEIAARQGGVIRRTQALELGLTAKMIRSRVMSEQWSVVSRGVYRLLGARDYRELLHGAVATLPNAVVSHQSAARIHAISGAPIDPVTVTVHSSTTHRFVGVVVRRCVDLAPHHIEEIDGLPTTTLARTVVDLAGVVSSGRLARIVDELVVGSRMELDGLAALVDEIARRGKPGSAALREVLDERRDAAWATATELERFGLSVLEQFGLPAPETQFPAPWGGAERLDAAYPEARVAIEWDSRRWHTRAADFERDRRRDRRAAVHGWIILRVTWRDLKQRSAQVAADVGAILAGAVGDARDEVAGIR